MADKSEQPWNDHKMFYLLREAGRDSGTSHCSILLTGWKLQHDLMLKLPD